MLEKNVRPFLPVTKKKVTTRRSKLQKQAEMPAVGGPREEEEERSLMRRPDADSCNHQRSKQQKQAADLSRADSQVR